MEKTVFKELYEIDCNSFTESKNNLKYLSWAHAWKAVKEKYSKVSYKVLKFENNLPYTYDSNTGYMVFTEVTIDDLTHEMWLPVMNNTNKAMKSVEYTAYGKKIAPATMFDINKTIMRCLTKNLAMFGLGLYIYAGEDLPEKETEYLNNDQIGALKAIDKFNKIPSMNMPIEKVEASRYHELVKYLKEE